MATINLSQSGATGAIKVYASANELYTDGNYRGIYLSVYALPNDGFNGDRDGKWTFSVDGSNDSGSSIINGNGMWLYDDTISVYVEPGTTYANVDISFSASLYSPSAKSWRTVNGSITKISGLSIVADTSLSSVKDINFGEACSVTWVPASSSFTYKLQFSMGNYRHTTDVIRPGTTGTYTYTELVIPEAEAVNIPNSEYGTVAVSLTQYSDYSGTVSVGASSTKSFRITLRDSAIPTITSYSATIDNSGNSVVQQWGVALAGYTKVRVDAAASGIYGSTIKSFSISGDYKANVEGDSLSYTGKAIGRSGNRSFIIRCTDSRGRVSEQVITPQIHFLPYTAPKARKLSMRKEDYGDTDPSNDRMIATPTWTFDPVDEHNSATGKLYYKVSTADDWTEHPGVLENNTPFLLSDLRLSEEISYNFKVVVTDLLGVSSSKEAFSSTTRVLMDYQAGGMGLGIGKICEIDNVGLDTQSLEVSMDSYFFGEVYIKDKTQTLENYIKKVTKYLVEYEDYGDDHPSSVIDNPQPGQIYYMKVAEG